VAAVAGALLPCIGAVSAPGFDHKGKLVLAISAPGSKATFDANPDGASANAVKSAATALSARPGYLPLSNAASQPTNDEAA
jgi:DNA-binding IclR family transcriptional regulator